LKCLGECSISLWFDNWIPLSPLVKQVWEKDYLRSGLGDKGKVVTIVSNKE